MIIPLAHHWTWRDLPRAALTLTIIMILSQWYTQHSDAEKWNTLVEHYQSSVLPQLEYPVFLSHLYQNGRREEATKIEAAWSSLDRTPVYHAILRDLSFTHTLKGRDRSFWGEKDYPAWRDARQTVNDSLPDISWVSYSAVPAQARSITFFTHAFLHQDTWQLAGYVLLILLAGLVLEPRVGAFFFGVGFLVSTALAAWFACLSQPQSFSPILGASAGCFGLLGMLVVYYGTGTCRFLYPAGFKLAERRLPALVIAPLWPLVLSIDIARHYPEFHAWSHPIVGLLVGTFIMLALKRWLLTDQTLHLTPSPDTDATPELSEQQRLLAKALQALEDFNFRSARDQLRSLHQAYPEDPAIIQYRYALERLDNQLDICDSLAAQVFTTLTERLPSPQWLDTAFAVFPDYQARHPLHEMPAAHRLAILQGWVRLGELKAATTLARQMVELGNRDPLFDKALDSLIGAWNKAGDRQMASRCERLLSQPTPNSDRISRTDH